MSAGRARALPERASVRLRRANVDDMAHTYLSGVAERVAAHRGVRHPFLSRYAKTGVPHEAERKLYAQCYHYFRDLPFFILGIAQRTRDERILREVTATVLDEVADDPTHSELYRSFLDAIGVDDVMLNANPPLPATRMINEGVRRLYNDVPVQMGLGALFADEIMSSIMVAQLDDGLAASGWDEEVRYFWILHREAELGHGNAIYNAVEPHVRSASQRTEFDAGADALLALLEAYWDSVEKMLALPR